MNFFILNRLNQNFKKSLYSFKLGMFLILFFILDAHAQAINVYHQKIGEAPIYYIKSKSNPPCVFDKMSTEAAFDFSLQKLFKSNEYKQLLSRFPKNTRLAFPGFGFTVHSNSKCYVEIRIHEDNGQNYAFVTTALIHGDGKILFKDVSDDDDDQ